VTSFVRKLVADLQNSINNDPKLNESKKSQIEVHTLHKFARSIVEKSHGTANCKFKPHFKMIGQTWKNIVWKDVLEYYTDIDRDAHGWEQFEEQLHKKKFSGSATWKNILKTYSELCQFYNASGFGDLIIRAEIILKQNPDLSAYDFLIIDEYQDFNPAEGALVACLINGAKGLLIVGDDDQVLYEKLKSGTPELLRKLYEIPGMAKALLPFCGRSSYHIIKAAYHFIQSNREPNRIEKIFLPVTLANSAKVQLIACTHPSAVIDYIEKFVSKHQQEINERKDKLLTGEKRDAYLLILTPVSDVSKFLGTQGHSLQRIVSSYRTECRGLSEDYYKILNYHWLGRNSEDNFTFRKVLCHEGIDHREVHTLILEARAKQCDLRDIDSEIVKRIMAKTRRVRNVIDSEMDISEKIKILSLEIKIDNTNHAEIEEKLLSQSETASIEDNSETEVEGEDVQKMCAVELVSIVGSKGLSADHVIIIGFDDVNMKYVSKNAFYVSLTRARNSLHILTSLQCRGASKPHNFLDQLPEDNLEFYKHTKTNHTTKLLTGRQEFLNYISSQWCRLKIKCHKS
jgi:superfamily I DNA/RNA helicase